MVSSGSQTRLDETEYEVIESALSETERGRRFLKEFARRHRGADTQTLLNAITRLESAVTRDAADPQGVDTMRGELVAMADSIARARSEIAAVAPDGDEEASPATLETLVQMTERATSAILGAAESMQEAAWSLRETGADAALCGVLDRRAIAIYTACSLQDLSAQRTGCAVAVLRDVEARIAALLGQGAPSDVERPGETGPSAAPSPLPEFAAVDDIDFVESRAEADPPPAGPHPNIAAAPADDTDDLALAFADLDRLSIEEKIALFS